jgi:hypothetical protein
MTSQPPNKSSGALISLAMRQPVWTNWAWAVEKEKTIRAANSDDSNLLMMSPKR